MSLDSFIRLANSLVEFESDYIDNRYPSSTLHALEVHKFELKTTWSRIKQAFEKYLFDKNNEEEEADPANSVDLETLKVKYKSTYITYCNLLTRISEDSARLRSESIKENEPPSPIVQPVVFDGSSSTATQGHRFHLPPCEIETFKGDYKTWPTFRDLFSAMYVKNCSLSPIEKLFHLTQKTSGEAREIVMKSPLTNQGFEMAWSSLKERFENRRILVNGQLKTLFGLQTIGSESGRAIQQLQREINSCISILKLHGIDVESWDPIFVFLSSNCLPDLTLTLWEQGIRDKSSLPKWSDLDSFLTNRYRTLESVSEIRKSAPTKPSDFKSKSTNNSFKKVNTFQNNIYTFKCPLCPKDSHVIRKCPKFHELNILQRFNEIKKQGLCINCFSKTHSVRSCKSKNSCSHCKKRHNTLLHKDSDQTVPPVIASSSNSGSSLNPNSTPFTTNANSATIQSTPNLNLTTVESCFVVSSKGVLLGTALVDICHCGIRYRARALLDSGSEGSFISEKFFNRLKLPFTRINAQISGLNNSVAAEVSKQSTFVLSSIWDQEVQLPVTALVVPRLSNNLPSKTLDMSQFSSLPDFPLADPQFYISSNIDILIGGDLFPSVILSGVKHKVFGSLMGQETIFGWILSGPLFKDLSETPTIVSYYSEISLDKQISRFWEIEDLPRKSIESLSDQFCEDLFNRTTRRNKDGRYIVSLPFKEGYPETLKLGQSRNCALAQFLRNEGRLRRSPSLKTEYDAVVQEYMTLDHMVKVAPPDKNIPNYYLPHHAVIKPDSTTTKVRVVFNASSSSSNGLSLNDILHTGPVLQSDLTLLILKWRFFRYVFNADIQKMYRQILVDPNHTKYQRILFRDNPDNNIQDYELKTVTFGVNCAPYLAIRTILQLADDIASSFPIASKLLRNSMYVDDILAGAHTIREAVISRNELIFALQSAGFCLRKWTANSKEILRGIPLEHLLYEDFLDFDDSSSAKTLGIRWNARSDYFYFVAKPFTKSSICTKREVLSQIAKLFDPAGWLSPCIVLAKILMQRIWIEGTKWDEVLSPDSLETWKTFQSKYSVIDHIRIPRWINFTPNAEIQFHGFCDASEKAYAAALYIRISKDNIASSHLVASKTKVAPVKTLSIPRLELCGAVLLADMLDSLLPKLDIGKYSLVCWTDSTIVLSWLAKPACSWLTFVANRVSKITKVTEPSYWRHCNSEYNPADLASRGLYPQDLSRNNLWWHGPSWLTESEEKWPRYEKQIHSETQMELKTIRVNFSYFQSYEDILDRFSSFPKALRIVAYIYRFYFRTHPTFRSSFQKNSFHISSSEILFVRNKLISICQKINFPNEYQALDSRRSVSSSSSILNLNPFLDEEGIIRSCGRLERAPGLPYDERHPMILPYQCQYSRLLVKFIHDICLHGGNQLVLRLIRTQYWIPRVKNLIKATIRRCKVCIIYKKRCQQQIMASLPPERTEISRPFTHTGLDFAGPFDIKSYNGRSCRLTKGYVCVFICFSTKAIHLEGTTDLSTATFLAAFNRFVSRRGCPLHLHSDNGTTFVGASKILTREFLQVSRESLTSNYAHQNLTWHFIPPGAPHMGGLWEAGVKSFKCHFRKISGGYKYTFEEFCTLLARVEACLNSRPLSPMSQDPMDLSSLTPGHFLIGSPIITPIDPKITEQPMSIVNRWQRLKLVHQHFCARWKNEYLKELQKRIKWKKPEENIKENALVVIKDENLPPNSWRLGRITKVYYGSDRFVRVADIFTQKGTITRPITKIICLPID